MISGIKTCGHHQERANERDVPIGKPKTRNVKEKEYHINISAWFT